MEYTVASKLSQNRVEACADKIKAILQAEGITGHFFLFDDFIGLHGESYTSKNSLIAETVENNEAHALKIVLQKGDDKEVLSYKVAFTISMLEAFKDMQTKNAKVLAGAQKAFCEFVKMEEGAFSVEECHDALQPSNNESSITLH